VPGKIISLLLVGCAVPAPYVPSHQAISPGATSRDLSGLRRGLPFERARARLEQSGATNIAVARSVSNGVVVEAMTADLAPVVLLFRDGRLHRSLPIGCDAGTNTRVYLHLAEAEGTAAVIVVAGELRSQGVPSVFVLLDREAPRRYVIAFDYFPEWFRGVVDPKIVGTKLALGVTFVARGDDGLPWQRALVLACDGRSVSVTPLSMRKALGCECLYEWFNRGR
jgi:hypothetical protein